ncbi:MAG: XRE family transcriptional regulator [Alphaproteobacteria bacterium]|nr:MAG: XRE family transcriptional regulator [Alphaproteobacteria bacterium]
MPHLKVPLPVFAAEEKAIEEKPVRRRGRGQTSEPESERKRLKKIDAHVGARIKLRRTLLGLSQEALGEKLGLTFQQVQKYERGMNRVGASRLHKVSEVLDVPVSFFFDDLAADLRRKSIPLSPTGGENDADLTRREILELARAFDRIADDRVRKRIVELIRSLSAYELPESAS